MAKVNPCRTNESEAKTEFASRGSVSKKERKSCSSRTDDVESIVDTSDLCLVGTEIEDTGDDIACGRGRDRITSSDLEILERWGKHTQDNWIVFT